MQKVIHCVYYTEISQFRCASFEKGNEVTIAHICVMFIDCQQMISGLQRRIFSATRSIHVRLQFAFVTDVLCDIEQRMWAHKV